ncbi:MAG: right-handed parallel beta-helix repeat-containing protein [Chitinophagaceae bacterium]|nr:right-handed parallel beta-helix repeat-containing protein [Chitinophagaceae bacterium]
MGKLRYQWLVAILFSAAITLQAQTPVVVHAADFGVKPNSYEDAAAGLQKALAACKRHESSVLVLPGGRIDVWPEESAKRELYISNSTESDTLSKGKHIAFLLEDHKNIAIEGNNTLVVLHGKMMSFVLQRCRQVSIRNLAFDYERPTMTELTISAVNKNIIEARFHPDSKFKVENGKLILYGEGWVTKNYHAILFDPVTERMHYSSLQPLLQAKAAQTGPQTVAFEGDFTKPPYKSGDVLTVRDPYRDNSGALIEQSRDISLYNLRMHYMHGLGIVSQFSENITLRKVQVAPRKESGRVISSFADCFHFSGCRGKVIVDSCFASGSHDDPINVHGTHMQITGVHGAGRLTVRFMHHQTYGFPAFFAGDSIAFVNPQTLLPLGYGRVRSATLVNNKEMELELHDPLPADVREGICVENITWTPEVVITNSRFERTNTRGLLITTRRPVRIENNVLYHTGMFPILIADDASSWFESGPVQDVVIRNNVFDGCGYNSSSGAINIAPENHAWEAGKYVHRNIRIVDNTFRALNNAVLQARSVDGLVFSGNTIEYLQGSPKTDLPAVQLDGCSGVLIERNKVSPPILPIIKAVRTKRSDVKTDMEWSGDR